jgi:hypothetical protein
MAAIDKYGLPMSNNRQIVSAVLDELESAIKFFEGIGPKTPTGPGSPLGYFQHNPSWVIEMSHIEGPGQVVAR